VLLDLNASGFAAKTLPVAIPAKESLMLEAQLEPLGEPRLWSEFEPSLHEMKASLDDIDCVSEIFGLRQLSANPGLTLNGKRIFLRSEANCAVFPLTGCAPMDEGSWEKLFETYMNYGINAVRFHSWCPPEAAFRVADRLGLLLAPELSCWNCDDMFKTSLERQYYKAEAIAILDAYGGHPSFAMLSLGNELHFSKEKLCGEDGLEHADSLLKSLGEKDPSKLYAFASNGYYGWQPPTGHSSFHHAQSWKDLPLRAAFAGNIGQIYDLPPETCFNYSEGAKEFSVPLISFEAGQYQVFPDVLYEPQRYVGPLEPGNFMLTRDALREKGFSEEEIRKMIEASGELSFLGYRQEIEAALRTPEFSGISLLGLQDFPGQGTALVGMMNALGDPKPYPFSDPARFRKFFAPVALLAEIPKFVWQSSESFSCNFLVANYGSCDIVGEFSWRLCYGDIIIAQHSSFLNAKQGGLTMAQSALAPLASIAKPSRLVLELSCKDASTSYDIWVYPEIQEKSRNVFVARIFGDEAFSRLEAGETVLLSPNPESLPKTVKGQFETAFWSVGFGQGTLGISVDPKHPVFAGFPTFSHSSFQWYNLAKNGRPMILDDLTDNKGNRATPLVAVVDGFTTLRRLGLLYEARVGNGKLMVSSLGLEEGISHPEVRAFRESILDYMESDAFNPAIEIDIESARANFLGDSE
jgi:hypothetical protein